MSAASKVPFLPSNGASPLRSNGLEERTTPTHSTFFSESPSTKRSFSSIVHCDHPPSWTTTLYRVTHQLADFFAAAKSFQILYYTLTLLLNKKSQNKGYSKKVFVYLVRAIIYYPSYAIFNAPKNQPLHFSV